MSNVQFRIKQSYGTVSGSSSQLTLYLIRHGETEWARDHIAYGHAEAELTEQGLQQSERLGQALEAVPLDAIYSSDLRRAIVGAEMIATGRGLAVSKEPWLREINMGEWEGKSIPEITMEHPTLVERLFNDPMSFRFPGGESFQGFHERVWNGIARLVETHTGTVAIVTHAGVLRMIVGEVLEVPPKNWLKLAQDFGCINIVEWHGGTFFIRRINAD